MMRTGIPEMLSVAKVVRSGLYGRYSAGEKSLTARLEREASAFLDGPSTLAVSSGTSALMAALVGVGVGPGDEVLVPAYSWVSTAAAPLALGAVPVLVEIDESLMMDPLDAARKITSRTKAIVPVHMLNLVADMDAIRALAALHSIAVVEDACQAFGVRYHGQRAGTLGDAGAFSFSMTKNISSGEGGLVVTTNARVMDRARMMHDVGSYTRATWTPSAEPLFVGLNMKLTELASAVLLPQLRRLDRSQAHLSTIRAAMAEELAKVDGLRITPHHSPDDALGLTVVFDDVEEARWFANQPGADRLIETGRHVFTNWESIRGRRTYDERFAPYRWAQRDGEPEMRATDFPVTLDVLARTVRIWMVPWLPVFGARMHARRFGAYRTRVPRPEPLAAPTSTHALAR